MRRFVAIMVSVIVCIGILSGCDDQQVVVTAPFDIFQNPDYDSILVDTIWEKGVFTILEEKEDGEGNLWGKLKSGQGWVNLTKISNDSKLPIRAGLIQEKEVPEDAVEMLFDESEYMVRLAFLAKEELKDIRFTSIYLTDEGVADDTLHSLSELKEGQVFVAGVVFAGDMTSFGLEFIDAKGELRYYSTYISGRNGELILQEEETNMR